MVQMCRALGVSRAGYYAWRTRSPSAATARRAELTAEAKQIHAQAKGRYGSPRIHAELVARGHGCSANLIAKLMRRAGIVAKTTRKFRHTTDSNHALPVVENMLFSAYPGVTQFILEEPGAVAEDRCSP